MSVTRHALHAAAAAAAWPAAASAHFGTLPPPLAATSLPWTFDAAIVVPLLLMGGLYARGLPRLWGRPAAHAAAPGWSALLAFAAALLALVVALLSPLHALAEHSFAAHMVQHELLMVVAAPLLVIGRTALGSRAGLPRTLRRPFARAARHPWARAAGGIAVAPVAAWALHGLALWIWHVPALFDATQRSDAVHAAQHVAFLGSAWLFWRVALDRRTQPFASLAMLFTTAVHSALLGALLTVARLPWYAPYAGSAAYVGLTPLEDQQLGGLVMWIPAGFAYVAAALAVGARTLRPTPPEPPARRLHRPAYATEVRS